MKRILLSGALLAFCMTCGMAKADDASDRLKLAEQVVATAHVADNMRMIMPMMMAQLKPLVEQGNSADAADLDKFTQLFTKRANEAADRFAEQVAQIYAKAFSAEDLTNLLAFYKTPTGQDLLAKQPEIAQSSLAIGRQLGQDLAKQVLDEMKEGQPAKP